ncbi:B12-binding domain-containing radical SAM protein [Chloroflexota bacterium]
MVRPFLLVNTNMARPPVSPVGLEYVGEALVEADVPVRVLDLAFEDDWQVALKRELAYNEPLVIGLSVRNTDDCCFATRKSFLPWIKELVTEVRRLSGAFILLGGIGFSVLPEITLRVTEADAGIAGDAEEVVSALAGALAGGEDIYHLPNMVYFRGGNIIRNPRVDTDLRHLPVPRRRLFNNKKYEELGAMVGVETKRGCAHKCIFCADPVAKGSTVRRRPPEMVVKELRDLVDQGVSWIYLCDSEFNLPIAHARDICRAIIQSGLGDKLRWYCYCSPVPFDRELVQLMKRAGCQGVNFGVDSLCDEQLYRLGRSHTLTDIRRLVELLPGEGFNYMFDLLVGGPGETEATVKSTIERIKELKVPLAGIAYGIRIYPDTLLERAIADGSIKGGLYSGTGCAPHQPVFYLSPLLDNDIAALINHFVAGDPRFLVLAAPDEEGSYNYADDEMLGELIRQGARGAYWDILQKKRSAAK